MLRRRFHSSGIHPSNASNGVYGVTKNLKLLPPNKVDAECIGVALIHKGHRIMIEKNESKNPSYKQATEGMLASDNFVWGEYLVDQYEIPNYDTIDYDYQGLTSAYLMSNSGVYNGQPHIPNDISQWTGVMSDWNGYKGWEPAPFYWVSRVYDHSMSRTNRTEEVRRLYRVNVRPLLNSTIHPELELCSELDQ